MPLQFAYVYRDYFTHYQRRSAFYYDPAAFRGVAEYLIASDPSAIVVDAQMDDVSAKWRFYATKHGREDLLQRTTYVDDLKKVAAARPGALAISYAEDGTVRELLQAGSWSIVKTISDLDSRRASVILRKN